MFTGIVESTGLIESVIQNGGNKTFIVSSPLSKELKTDQSLSHNGVCLTVEKADGETHQVTAIEETLKKSNLGRLQAGGLVNLERCMLMNGRIDGHIVQGHVDDTAVCTSVVEKEGSFEYVFRFDKKFAALVIEKGSVSLNGISLTVFNVSENQFTVAIIPYTYNNTNIGKIQPGDEVNIEFDLIGKYILRMQELKSGS